MFLIWLNEEVYDCRCVVRKLFFIQFTKGNFTTVIKHIAFKNSYLQSFKFTHVSSI